MVVERVIHFVSRAMGCWWTALSLLALILAATGCSATQSAFARSAGNAGSALAAAATTLAYTHTGKLTTAYAQASFVNFQSELTELDQQLPSLSGAPNQQTTQRLVALYRQAERAIEKPCLEDACNWREQVIAMTRASKALIKASGA